MTVEVQSGAPLEALDFHCYLAGVLVDPESIEYAITPASGGLPITDEDGATVTGISPYKLAVGHYDARPTVLSPATAAANYIITWSVVKVPAGPTVTRAETFTLLDELAVDPTTQGQTRRDVADTTETTKLRTLLQDNAADDTAWAFFNSELVSMIEDAVTQHTAGARSFSTATADDLAMSMLLAQYDGLVALAGDARRYFRWTDGNESLDKTPSQQGLAAAAKGALAKYEALMQRRVDQAELGQTGNYARDLMRWRARRSRRRR